MNNTDYYEQQRAKWRRKRRAIETRESIEEDYQKEKGKS